MIKIAWNSDKSAGDLIKSSDWDDMVGAIGSTSIDLKNVTKIGSGNTYIKVDADNDNVQVYIAGNKVAEWG